jgi:hypothetical protein
MKTYKVISVSPVITGKDGRDIHVLTVVDDSTGESTTLIRTPTQLKKDLEGSFLKYDRLNLASIIGETVSGDVRHYKKGETYTANEYSSAVKAGTAKIGDAVTHSDDGNRIEGFLTFQIGSFDKMKALMSC